MVFTVDKATSWTEYSLDGQANVTIAGNTTLSSLSEGGHNIVVYANSTSGYIGKSNTVYFAIHIQQCNITFDQMGVGSDFTATVLAIDGTNYTANNLPISFMWDNGSTHTFAFQSPLVVSLGAKEYDWISTSGLSILQSDSITIIGSGSVTGDYVARAHDVAVTNVVVYVPHCSSKVGNDLWVFQGQPVYTNVTVSNKGDFDENINVTLSYNTTTTVLREINSTNLLQSAGGNQTITFVWNTTGLPYNQNYTLTAVATIPTDNNLTGNSFSVGPITVRIVGDINGDGKVDGKDIALEALSFGSCGPDFLYPGSPPSPRWNSDCDINGDNKIDGKDLTLTALNFGLN